MRCNQASLQHFFDLGTALLSLFGDHFFKDLFFNGPFLKPLLNLL